VRLIPLATLLIVGLVVFFLRGPIRAEVVRLFSMVPARSASTPAEYQAVLYQQVSKENARLTDLLTLPQDRVVATGRVVARPPRTLYDTLLVAVDPHAGVVAGDEARFNGVPMGTVSSVSGESATVILYSAPGATFEVKAGTPSAIVVMKGLGGGSFLFEIPTAVSIAPGDLVESSAGSGTVAVVRSVRTTEGSASASVYAGSPVSPPDLDYVEFFHPR
jgi:cell shape-determining protein MreC